MARNFGLGFTSLVQFAFLHFLVMWLQMYIYYCLHFFIINTFSVIYFTTNLFHILSTMVVASAWYPINFKGKKTYFEFVLPDSYVFFLPFFSWNSFLMSTFIHLSMVVEWTWISWMEKCIFVIFPFFHSLWIKGYILPYFAVYQLKQMLFKYFTKQICKHIWL